MDSEQNESERKPKHQHQDQSWVRRVGRKAKKYAAELTIAAGAVLGNQGFQENSAEAQVPAPVAQQVQAPVQGRQQAPVRKVAEIIHPLKGIEFPPPPAQTDAVQGQLNNILNQPWSPPWNRRWGVAGPPVATPPPAGAPQYARDWNLVDNGRPNVEAVANRVLIGGPVKVFITGQGWDLRVTDGSPTFKNMPGGQQAVFQRYLDMAKYALLEEEYKMALLEATQDYLPGTTKRSHTPYPVAFEKKYGEVIDRDINNNVVVKPKQHINNIMKPFGNANGAPYFAVDSKTTVEKDSRLNSEDLTIHLKLGRDEEVISCINFAANGCRVLYRPLQVKGRPAMPGLAFGQWAEIPMTGDPTDPAKDNQPALDGIKTMKGDDVLITIPRARVNEILQAYLSGFVMPVVPGRVR